MEQYVRERAFQYEILEKIGQGKNGIVYRANDTEKKRVVALKVLGPEITSSERFRSFTKSALRAYGRVEHPALTTIYELIPDDDNFLIVSEYVEGHTIKQLLRSAPLQPGTFVELARQIASGLNCLHQRELAHGNLHPSNIMVRRDGQVKITDFGLPRRLGLDVDVVDEVDYPLEAVQFCSPEQARGEGPALLGDIFSLGAVFYMMLAGQPPFLGGNRSEIAEAVQKGRLDCDLLRLAHVPGEMVRLTQRMLAQDKKERCRTVDELLITLDSIDTFEHDLAVKGRLSWRHLPSWGYPAITILTAILLIAWIVITSGR